MNYTNQLPPKSKNKYSQCQQIKEYLLAGNTLTSFEACKLFNITNLPQRVHDLRTRYNFDVITTNVTHNGSRFAVYSCDTTNDQQQTPTANAPVEA